MAVKYGKHNESGLFYITITCTRWLCVFSQLNAYDVVYNWFDYLKKQGHYVFAYTIMPNHFHCIIGMRQNKFSINTLVSNGKRFMAYDLVKRLTAAKEYTLLQALADAVVPSDQRRGKLHQVFEPSFDCKECYSPFFIQQKLAYIHNNPVRGKWQLAPHPGAYIHSSASFYLTGALGLYPVVHLNSRHDLDFGPLE